MTYNSALADEIAGIIGGTPERHRQYLWASVPGRREFTPATARNDCGTTACVAGWAAILTLGEEWTLDDAWAVSWLPDEQAVRISIRSAGQQALGLTRQQADWLFDSCLHREEVLWALKWLRDHQDAGYEDLDDGFSSCQEAGT